MKSVIITGASSGIGKAAAIGLAQSGFQVFGLARNYEDLVNLRSEITSQVGDLNYIPIQFDVTKHDTFDEILNNIVKLSSEKSIYGLVNSAGYLEPGAIEDVEIDSFRSQFETNFFGLIAFTKKVLPIMMSNNEGRIVNVSSLSGLISLPLLGAYSATKYALEAASDALRVELWKTGIKVININPAIVETKLLSVSKPKVSNLIKKSRLAAAYDKYLTKMPPGLPPSAVAADILKAISSPNPKLRYIVAPNKIKIAVNLLRFVPEKFLFSQLAKKLS